MKVLLIVTTLALLVAEATQAGEWKLVWSDEFKDEGLPDASKWNYEEGFCRNEEMQYYMRERKQNSRVENGHLILEGHKEHMPNPRVGKEPHTIHANNHFANPTIKDKSLKGRAIHKSAGGGKITIKEPYKEFHVYAIEWNEREIKFFVDDKQYATFKIDLAGEGPNNPFRKPHYLLLNLAMGGSWGGKIDDSVLPQKYEIDYVRYYKPKTGQQTDSGAGK